MGRVTKLFLALAWIAVSPVFAEPFADGLCTFDTSSPNLPKAICYAPACPEGATCRGPKLDLATATIQFKEPTFSWKDTCPDKSISSACIETFVDFTAHLGATGDSGTVTDIGVNVSQSVTTGKGIEKVLKKSWGKAIQKDPQGHFTFDGGMTLWVMPGKRFELSPYEFCARDNLNNETCGIPTQKIGQLNANSLLRNTDGVVARNPSARPFRADK